MHSTLNKHEIILFDSPKPCFSSDLWCYSLDEELGQRQIQDFSL